MNHLKIMLTHKNLYKPTIGCLRFYHTSIFSQNTNLQTWNEKLAKLSKVDPQLHNIMAEYSKDIELFNSSKDDKIVAHRLFECSSRIQSYLSNVVDKKHYESGMLLLLDSDLARECSTLNRQLSRQLEKHIFSL